LPSLCFPGDAAVAGGEAFGKTEAEIGRHFAGEKHLKEGAVADRGAEADPFDWFEPIALKKLFEFGGFDEERIDMHVFRGVFHEPVDPFDDEEIAEGIAVESVEEKEAARFKDPARLGDEEPRVFDVL